MKVRITKTVEVDDEHRSAMRHFYGQAGMATREEVRDWYIDAMRSMDEDMLHDYQLYLERKKEQANDVQ